MWSSPLAVFGLAFCLRAALLIYGIYQDSTSAFKYTDIDYYVFTDAARAMSQGRSPYTRDTYRYTPILAWILLPTSWPGGIWFHFGKVVFAMSDLVAGFFIMRILQQRGLPRPTALKYAAVWLLNPMVAQISTRGSSEGLLCVLVMALLYTFVNNQILLSGIILGFSVHFKIYPFIYASTLYLALETPPSAISASTTRINRLLRTLLSPARLTLALSALSTFLLLTTAMYIAYGPEFLQHTYFHHLTRIDHRHNFSPYNLMLYLSSARSATSSSSTTPTTFPLERLAFLPQLLLSALLIPLSTPLSPHTLGSVMLAQTLAFVTFNKVCTSQYFLWYLIFLPLYLPGSSFIRRPYLGLAALGAWVLAQAVWLQRGYELEFLGRGVWLGLWGSSLGFLGVNCWVLGVVCGDLVGGGKGMGEVKEEVKREKVGGKGAKVENKAREGNRVVR